MRKAKWAPLLTEYPDFKRWYDNLARGSQGTAKERARVLYRFLIIQEMNPSSLIEFAKKDRSAMEDLLMDFVTELHEKEHSPGYIEHYVRAIKSWLNFNEVQLVRKIKIANRNATPTIEDERVPMDSELKQILNSTNERGRATIALMAFSGLRIGALGNMNGLDGLTFKDFPEMEIHGKEVVFTKVPTRVVVRSSMSKAGHRYLTFLGEEGCGYLKEYLENRLLRGEVLTKDSAIIAVTFGYANIGNRAATDRDFGLLTTKTVSKIIRDAMRPRFMWRPYVLRSYFATQLMVAENHGKISHAYRQFFMGHKGDMEARYTTNKGRLPDYVIEDMRESYLKCQEYLETSRSGESDTDSLRKMFRMELLKVAGYSEDEIGELDLSVDDELLQEMVRKRLVGAMLNNGANQKIVDTGEVERFLARGWNYVATLPNERIILQLPH